MKTMVTFRHMPASNALRDHAEEKAEKFMKYLIDPVDIHVVLMVEKIRQIAEITVKSKNFTAHGVEESTDMYTSIDKVTSKIEAQLRKHKEKVKAHKSESKAYEAIEATLPQETGISAAE
ncbi:MAG: ribosome-associated translation inhibitor RaiA [Deltaproteobacteria bacterium]|nr:ribosome-associated translation inhibitor RaiA [Deltaproteobacteria bacterium]